MSRTDTTDTSATPSPDPEGSAGPPTPRTPSPAAPSKWGERGVAVASHVILSLWALAVVLPLVWTFFSSLKDSRSINVSPFALPDVLHWDNYVRAWNSIGVARYLFNTLVVVGSALVLVMILGAMSAYGAAPRSSFSRHSPRS